MAPGRTGASTSLTHAAVKKLYPGRLEEFRRICERYDPTGVFRNAYAQRVLGFSAAAVSARPPEAMETLAR